MAIALLSILVKHKRRIRLVFSSNLAASAFTDLSKYSVVSQTSAGGSPAVVASIAVSGSPTNLELALGDDLTPGGRYMVSAVGVVGADASVTSSTSAQIVAFGLAPLASNAEEAAGDNELALYGRDLIWNGLDFEETASGDLATVEGGRNVRSALSRRLNASGLPWNPAYGPNARSYVNGTAPGINTLSGALMGQCTADDRVKSALVTLEELATGEPVFVITPTLIGNEKPAAISVTVPTP